MQDAKLKQRLKAGIRAKRVVVYDAVEETFRAVLAQGNDHITIRDIGECILVYTNLTKCTRPIKEDSSKS